MSYLLRRSRHLSGTARRRSSCRVSASACCTWLSTSPCSCLTLTTQLGAAAGWLRRRCGGREGEGKRFGLCSCSTRLVRPFRLRPPSSLEFSDRPGAAQEFPRMAEAHPHHGPNATLSLHGLAPAHESPLSLHRHSPPPSQGISAEHSAEHYRRASSVSERRQKRPDQARRVSRFPFSFPLENGFC